MNYLVKQININILIKNYNNFKLNIRKIYKTLVILIIYDII
jgi:hypothetical protein